MMRLKLGTTSAYAENTAAEGTKKRKKRNYLRVRGEYSSLGVSGQCFLELPPRTRRILQIFRAMKGENGTTSAYAENTPN